MSMKDAAVHGEASGLAAQSEGQTVEHDAKDISAKKNLFFFKKTHMQARTKISSEEFRAAKSFLTFAPFFPPLQFTVLDEDALSQLVSFLEDLLVVYIGHGRDEALEEQQDVADPQGSESPQQPLPPLVPRQGRRPRLAAAAGIFKEGASTNMKAELR